MKKLIMVVCVMLFCVHSCSLAEMMRFEGEWHVYEQPWDGYEYRKLSIGEEYDGKAYIEENINAYNKELKLIELSYSCCLIEITDNEIFAAKSFKPVGFSMEDGGPLREEYSIISGEVITEFFQKAYGIWMDIPEDNRIMGAKLMTISNEILRVEMLMEKEAEDYSALTWYGFRCPGDDGDGIKGKWMLSYPANYNSYSLEDDGTGICYFGHETVYRYDEENNIFELRGCDIEEPKLGEVINSKCIRFETIAYGKVFSYYLIKTSD